VRVRQQGAGMNAAEGFPHPELLIETEMFERMLGDPRLLSRIPKRHTQEGSTARDCLASVEMTAYGGDRARSLRGEMLGAGTAANGEAGHSLVEGVFLYAYTYIVDESPSPLAPSMPLLMKSSSISRATAALGHSR
jgi:hypothetical protein